MAVPRVLVTNEVPEAHLTPLLGWTEIILGPKDFYQTPRDEVLQLAPTLDGIINQGELRVDEELLDAAPRLKVVANIAAGVDNLDLPLMTARRVWATNAAEAFIEATADITLALILCVARRVVDGDRFVRAGEWVRYAPGSWDGILLRGQTLGIVGYGGIGRAVRQRAEAFGMNVIVHRRHPVPEPCYRTLDALLREADFVSLHTPLTAETHHLLDAARLALMKPTTHLINMARGPVVDEAALVEALCSGRLAGAGLDVYEGEPQVPDELKQMRNVTLLPHIGGATQQGRELARLTCARNVAAALRGEMPPNAVNQW